MANPQTAAQVKNDSGSAAINRRLAGIGQLYLFLIVTLAATFVFARYQVLEQPSLGDRANWDYFSQVIARGGVPYRDVVNIKSPFSAYLGAGMIVAARPFGLRDVLAIRLGFLALIALIVGCTMLVAARFEGAPAVGFIAAAAMLCFDIFVKSHNAGVQPKTPMVLFGLLALWAVAEDRPSLAGLCGM